MKKAKKPKVYFDPEFVASLKKNLEMSPHTWLLINNPVHAYLCEGEACRKRVNRPEPPKVD
jgi:uncharacterized protein YlaI